MTQETFISGSSSELLAQLPLGRYDYIGAQLVKGKLLTVNSVGILRHMASTKLDALFEIDLECSHAYSATMEVQNNKLLVAFERDIRVADLHTGELWKPEEDRLRQNIIGASFAPDGSVVALERRLTEAQQHVGVYALVRYDPGDLKKRSTYIIGDDYNHWATQLAVHEDKTIICDFSTLRVFNSSDVEEKSLSTEEERVIHNFSVSPDGKHAMIFTQSDNRYVKILSMETGKVVKTIKQILKGELRNPTWVGNTGILWSNTDEFIFQSTIDPKTSTFFTQSGTGLTRRVVSMDVSERDQKVIVVNEGGNVTAVPFFLFTEAPSQLS